jgi:hypothetical protein
MRGLSLDTRFSSFGLVVASSAHLSALNAAGRFSDATEPSRDFRPFGRAIFMAFVAAVFWWLARDHWRLFREWSDPATAVYWRNKAIGLTVVAVLSAVIAVCSLLYDFVRY